MEFPQFMPVERIAERASEFRKLYVIPSNQIPLQIEHVIENVLRIRIDPRENLSVLLRKKGLAIDAFLTADRSTIIVDYEQFISDQGENRLRFSLAHELGHWFLHQKEYEAISYKSEQDFIKEQLSIKPDMRKRFEIQANEFAAQLLVPSDLLMAMIEESSGQIRSFVRNNGKGQIYFLRSDLADDFAVRFGVSEEVVRNRIQNEGFIEHMIRDL